MHTLQTNTPQVHNHFHFPDILDSIINILSDYLPQRVPNPPIESIITTCHLHVIWPYNKIIDSITK